MGPPWLGLNIPGLHSIVRDYAGLCPGVWLPADVMISMETTSNQAAYVEYHKAAPGHASCLIQTFTSHPLLVSTGS